MVARSYSEENGKCSFGFRSQGSVFRDEGQELGCAIKIAEKHKEKQTDLKQNLRAS